MAIQQGLFLYPTQLSATFNENLLSSMRIGRNIKMDKDPKNIPSNINYLLRNKIIKIIIPKHMRISILKFLSEVNINSSTLFPGLEGFAKSLIIPTDIEMDEMKEIFQMIFDNILKADSQINNKKFQKIIEIFSDN